MTDREFIEAWNKYDTIQEIADSLGYTNSSIRTIATRMRRRGVNVPKKTTKEFYRRIGRMNKKERI